jgi:hypothetical protein
MLVPANVVGMSCFLAGRLSMIPSEKRIYLSRGCRSLITLRRASCWAYIIEDVITLVRTNLWHDPQYLSFPTNQQG